MEVSLFGLLIFGWFSTFTGVLLGGYLVHHASTDKPFFQRNTGDAYNLPDEFADQEQQGAEPPEDLKRFNERFRQAFGGDRQDYDPGQEIFDHGAHASVGAWRPPEVQEDEQGNIIEDETEENGDKE